MIFAITGTTIHVLNCHADKELGKLSKPNVTALHGCVVLKGTVIILMNFYNHADSDHD